MQLMQDHKYLWQDHQTLPRQVTRGPNNQPKSEGPCWNIGDPPPYGEAILSGMIGKFANRTTINQGHSMKHWLHLQAREKVLHHQSENGGIQDNPKQELNRHVQLVNQRQNEESHKLLWNMPKLFQRQQQIQQHEQQHCQPHQVTDQTPKNDVSQRMNNCRDRGANMSHCHDGNSNGLSQGQVGVNTTTPPDATRISRESAPPSFPPNPQPTVATHIPPSISAAAMSTMRDPMKSAHRLWMQQHDVNWELKVLKND